MRERLPRPKDLLRARARSARRTGLSAGAVDPSVGARVWCRREFWSSASLRMTSSWTMIAVWQHPLRMTSVGMSHIIGIEPMPVSFDEVREMALALPEAQEGTWYGTPGFHVRR